MNLARPRTPQCDCSPASNRRLRWVLGFLDNYTRNRDEGNGLLLDAGCGSGEYLPLFIERGWRVVAIDVDDSHIKAARARDNSQQIEFCIASLTHLPLKEETFDAIVCLDVLEHLDSPDKVIEQIVPIIKQDGIAVFSFPFLCDFLAHPLWVLFHRALDSLHRGHPNLLARGIFYSGKDASVVKLRRWTSLLIWGAGQRSAIEEYASAHLRSNLMHMDYSLLWLSEFFSQPHWAVFGLVLGSIYRGRPNPLARLVFSNTETPNRLKLRRWISLFVLKVGTRVRIERFTRRASTSKPLHLMHKHSFHPNEWLKFLQRNGLTVWNYSGCFISPPILWRVPGVLRLLYWVEDKLPRRITKWLGQLFVVATIKKVLS